MIIYNDTVNRDVIPSDHRHAWQLDPRAQALVCTDADCTLVIPYAWPRWCRLSKQLVALYKRPGPDRAIRDTRHPIPDATPRANARGSANLSPNAAGAGAARVGSVADCRLPTTDGPKLLSIAGTLTYPCQHQTLVSDFAGPLANLYTCGTCRQRCPACHGTGRQDHQAPDPRGDDYTWPERQAYLDALKRNPCRTCRGEGATRAWRATGRLSWRTFIAEPEPIRPRDDYYG
jgi:hypothetical protein